MRSETNAVQLIIVFNRVCNCTHWVSQAIKISLKTSHRPLYTLVSKTLAYWGTKLHKTLHKHLPNTKLCTAAGVDVLWE